MSLTFARRKLGYPLYAADFDPNNPDFLLVGGGGGWSATGVPNKISLLDTSIPAALNEIVDINLAKNEDSVSSLAVSESTPASLIAYAGINSSAEDQTAGKNEHFRSFIIGLPPRKRKADSMTTLTPEKSQSSVSTSPLQREALFTSAKGTQNDTYQRVLRASPPTKDSHQRLLAIASGLAPENEIIALRPSPIAGSVDEAARIALGKPEAADVDIEELGGLQGHALAYCTDNEVYIQRIPSSKQDPTPKARLIHQISESTLDFASSKRPKFRCLRFLTPHHILLLRNKPGKTGAELLILKTDEQCTQGRITFQKKLNASVKAAAGLDVCRLPESSSGERQFIVAVAGQDSSIELLTIDFVPERGMSAFKTFAHLKDIHSGPITKIVFSTPSLDGKLQSVRLASVSAAQTVTVHNLPLRSYSTSSDTPRYVLVTPGSGSSQTTFSVTMAILVICLVALLTQAFAEMRGVVSPKLGVSNWLNHQRMAGPGPVIPNEMPAVISAATKRAKDAMPYIPSIDELKEQLPSVVGVRDASTHIPSVDELKEQLNSLPSVEDVRADLENLIPSEDARPNVDNIIPSSEDIEAGIGSVIPSSEDIKAGLDNLPSVEDLKHSLEQLVSSQLGDSNAKAIIVRDEGEHGLSTELQHHTELVKHETLKKWEDLNEKQKKGWRQKLIDAGKWTEKQGESILKGILFSELAGAVGAAVRGG